jgi:hypothetical protein
LIDPWLSGGQSDVAAFFSQQWHATKSAVGTIKEVEDCIQRIGGEQIDLVVVSHEFTDHMHKETLLDIDIEVPIYATAKAAGIIRSWNHFKTVLDVPRFEGDWRGSDNIPDWIGISRLAFNGPDLLYYHSAIMITFSIDDQAEAVIYTPHGISPDNLDTLLQADPPIKTLALLHGLQDIQINTSWASSVKAQLNKGAHNGLKVQRLVNSKYWIGTHDEVKKGGGIVSWFLDRKIITLQEAFEQEKKLLEKDEGLKVDLADVRFEELGNGESLILA